MASELSPEEQIALIKVNLQEVLKPEIIDDVILKQKRPLVIYFGTRATRAEPQNETIGRAQWSG